MSSREAHQLRCRHRVIVDFGAKNRLETCFLGAPRDILYLGRPTPPAWDNADGQPLRHALLPIWLSAHDRFALADKFYTKVRGTGRTSARMSRGHHQMGRNDSSPTFRPAVGSATTASCA